MFRQSFCYLVKQKSEAVLTLIHNFGGKAHAEMQQSHLYDVTISYPVNMHIHWDNAVSVSKVHCKFAATSPVVQDDKHCSRMITVMIL